MPTPFSTGFAAGHPRANDFYYRTEPLVASQHFGKNGAGVDVSPGPLFMTGEYLDIAPHRPLSDMADAMIEAIDGPNYGKWAVIGIGVFLAYKALLAPRMPGRKGLFGIETRRRRRRR